MKATRKEIYFEEQESAEHFSMGVDGDWSAHWMVRCMLAQWHSWAQTIYVVDLYSWDRRKHPTEERHDQQLLGCNTDAAAQRAAMRLFGQRVQALAGTEETQSKTGQPESSSYFHCWNCDRWTPWSDHYEVRILGHDVRHNICPACYASEAQNLCAICDGPMSSRAETFRATRWWCDACQKRETP